MLNFPYNIVPLNTISIEYSPSSAFDMSIGSCSDIKCVPEITIELIDKLVIVIVHSSMGILEYIINKLFSLKAEI